MKLVLFGKASFNRQTFVQRIDYHELKTKVISILIENSKYEQVDVKTDM